MSLYSYLKSLFSSAESQESVEQVSSSFAAKPFGVNTAVKKLSGGSMGKGMDTPPVHYQRHIFDGSYYSQQQSFSGKSILSHGANLSYQATPSFGKPYKRNAHGHKLLFTPKLQSGYNQSQTGLMSLSGNASLGLKQYITNLEGVYNQSAPIGHLGVEAGVMAFQTNSSFLDYVADKNGLNPFLTDPFAGYHAQTYVEVNAGIHLARPRLSIEGFYQHPIRINGMTDRSVSVGQGLQSTYTASSVMGGSLSWGVSKRFGLGVWGSYSKDNEVSVGSDIHDVNNLTIGAKLTTRLFDPYACNGR